MEDELIVESPVSNKNADRMESTTLKEYHKQTINDLWNKDRIR